MHCPRYPECIFTFSKKCSKTICPLCQTVLPTTVDGRNRKIEFGISQENKKQKIDTESKKIPKAIKIDTNLYSTYHHGNKRSVVKLATKDKKYISVKMKNVF